MAGDGDPLSKLKSKTAVGKALAKADAALGKAKGSGKTRTIPTSELTVARQQIAAAEALVKAEPVAEPLVPGEFYPGQGA